MLNYYFELVALKIAIEKDIAKLDNLTGPSLGELLTSEKEFILDIFKDYYNNDSEMNQLEWFIDYLFHCCNISHNLAKYFWRKYIPNKYLQKSPTDKIGKCTGCIHFIKNNTTLKLCSCEAKPGYITQNALIKAYCQDYTTIEE